MNTKILKKYTLPKMRYRELYYAALQYNDWREELSELVYIGSAANMDGMPHGSTISDPTSSAAIRSQHITHKINAVEKCARLAGGNDLQRALLKGATTVGINYEWLRSHGYCFSGKRQYKEARHYFYYLLDKEL